MLHKSQYPSAQLQVIGWLATECGKHLPRWALDHFCATLLPVSPDRKSVLYYLESLPWLPLYACILLVGLVLKVLFFPVYALTNTYRAPYLYKQVGDCNDVNSGKMNFTGDFTVCTANICAISEGIAHVTGLKDTKKRCKEIGKKIVNSKNQNHDIRSGGNKTLKGNLTKGGLHSAGDRSHVSVSFPQNIDFICFQEISDSGVSASTTLVAELSQHFKYFVYNIGLTGWRTYFHLFDSGMMIASRYPILDVYYRPFSCVGPALKLASFGMVSIKVDLGITQEEKNAVGFIATTHLQSYQGNNPIHQIQMNEILQWQEEFRSKSLQDGEVVAFDVLCGDFNFDNMSPGEKHDSNHRLFDIYEDVCRVRPGKDHSWTIGTELRLPMLWDKALSTPERMKAALDDCEVRDRYLYDADMEDGMTYRIAYTHPDILKEEKLRENKGKVLDSAGRRRIDVILYRNENPVEVTDFKFVTQLAGLTDHIPVTMTFHTDL